MLFIYNILLRIYRKIIKINYLKTEQSVTAASAEELSGYIENIQKTLEIFMSLLS